jgi:hypothetical protein
VGKGHLVLRTALHRDDPVIRGLYPLGYSHSSLIPTLAVPSVTFFSMGGEDPSF